MKLKFITMTLAGLVASGMIALAQTQTPAGDNGQPTATPALAAANTTAPTTAENHPSPEAAPPAQDANAAQTNAVAATNATPAQDTAAATPTPVASAPAQRDGNAVIPLIVMDEVPLTDAIKNLARQAGLNYMLDPKIPYGTIGPDNRPIPQPMVSLRWENLTANEALTAVLNNYNLTVADDPKAKIARITVKDPAAPDPLVTKIIQLKYSDPTNMLASVQSVLLDKRSKVVPDIRTSQLVLVATEKEVAAVDELVARLDTQTKQVLIEARLVETLKNPSTTKGVDWTGTLQAQKVTFGNGTAGLSTGATDGSAGGTAQGLSGEPFVGTNSLGGAAGNTLGRVFSGLAGSAGPNGLGWNSSKGFFPETYFLNSDGVSAVLSFLNSEGDAKVLSTPRAVTLDNQEAVLTVTTAQPIFLTTAGTQGSPGGSQVTYSNVGTILHVTPRISANNTISLRVVPEVSSLGKLVTKTVAGVVNQADSFEIRRIETRVLIPSGNTLVMGGLLADSDKKDTTKVPLFGDVPGLGWFFRSEGKSQNKRNLIVFLTPTIVQDEDFQPTSTDFLKTKLSVAKPSDDFGAWDSGNPQDWSKLFGKKSDSSSNGEMK